MSTIGELSDIGVPDLIDVFTRRGRTGRLAVKAGGQEIHLFFEAGRLVLVTSTNLTLRLGRMLIRQGLLDTPRLLEALHAQAETGNRQPLGTILLQRSWVTVTDLSRCVEEQSIEALARVISEEMGIFVFDPGTAPPSQVDAVPLDPGVLLRAAKERTEALHLLRGQLPPSTTPLFLASTNGDLGPLDDLASPEAMVVGALRTGAKSISELSFHMALDELTLGVAVLSLSERGILVTGTSASAGQRRMVPRSAAG